MSRIEGVDVESAPVIYGKYQLIELLARGGMAEVFKAKAHGVEGFEKILVIKRILPELSTDWEFVELFINEAKIAVSLSHANLVQVFDLGKADDRYFIAMEYVAGHDLATVLRRGRRLGHPLPPELAVYLISEIAKGLDYAHRRRDTEMQPLHIVHRDVSPQNVLLSNEGEVKLTDFGIATTRLSLKVTDTGTLKGKYAYMSPEQARGEDVDHRTDIYALGVVLYEALAGHHPFAGPSPYETLAAVREGNTRPIEDFLPDLPKELRDALSWALAPAPEDRFQSAGHMYEELIQYLYSTRRRVGAPDLARYLKTIADEAERQEPEEDLRALFGGGPTRSGKRGASSGPRPIITRAQAERREVAALQVSMATDEPFPERRVSELIRFLGGALVTQSEDDGERRWVAFFGVKRPDGREAFTAADCASKIVAATRDAVDVSAGATTIQAGVEVGHVMVDAAGELIPDARTDRLIADVKRLTRKARFGTTQVSRSVAETIAHRFEVLEDEGLTLGKRLPVAQGRIVGRRDQLRRIGEVLAIATAGAPRLISIVGPPGIGKSRLLEETARRIRVGGHEVAMYLTQLLPQDRDIPLSACRKMLHGILGLADFASREEMKAQTGRLRELALTAQEVLAIEQTLGVTSVGDDSSQDLRLLRVAATRIAQKLAEDRLTVFAFDGVESIDNASRAILREMLERPRESKIVLLATSRPGSPLFDGLQNHETITLGPLDDTDIGKLTAQRLGTDELPPTLLRELSLKSGGNPLYIEEYLRALEDAGALEAPDGGVVTFNEEIAVDVPKTLRGIAAARVARVDAVGRHLLQIIAVADANASDEVLAVVSGRDRAEVVATTDALRERELLVTDATGHHFAHEVLRRVVYDGLPIEARRNLHGAIGHALAVTYPDHIADLAERLARHHREAGNLDEAERYWVLSADRLESERALSGAVDSLARAIEVRQQTPGSDHGQALRYYRRIGELCFRSRGLRQGAERMASALELAEALRRPSQVARFSMLRGRFLSEANSFAEGRRYFERARELARAENDEALLLDLTIATADADIRNGDYEGGVDLLLEALELARRRDDESMQMRALLALALAYAGMGKADDANLALTSARELPSATERRYLRCQICKADSIVAFYAEDHDRAQRAAEAALELAKEFEFHYEAAVNAHNLGELHLRAEGFKRAFALIRYSYETAREHGLVKLQNSNLRVLGFIDAMKFGSEKGRERILEAHSYAETNGFVWDLIQAKYSLAVVDQHQGRSSEAEALLRDVAQLSAQYGHARHARAAAEGLQRLADDKPLVWI